MASGTDPSTSGEAADLAPSYASVLSEAVGLALDAEFCPATAPNLRNVVSLARFFEFVLTIDYAPYSSHRRVGRVGLSDLDVRLIFEVGENLARARVKFENRIAKPYDAVHGECRDWHDLIHTQMFVGDCFEGVEDQKLFLDRIVIPAQALGIPLDYAVTTIWRFITGVGTYGTYTGSLKEVLARRGVEGLARRLWVDRHVVIPRLPVSKRRLLMDGLKTIQGLYFLALDGPSFHANSAWGRDGFGRSELKFKEMALTETGKRCEENIRVTREQVDKMHVGKEGEEERVSQACVWDADEALLIAQRIRESGGPMPPSLESRKRPEVKLVLKERRRKYFGRPWKLLCNYMGSKIQLRYHFIRR
ncbi:uncharacterized protein BKCO1_13000115 [Diplodia corticola]|uniref:Uncharacterized protein n=1 Tax=Diplodia corticola TaxID=236234 RepID=A0A1J9RU49_9PEZI|nr:uncharacterized protein BKCO1_13000115 [Diplodia corticola]OJD36099.1 hypothetical protein BKCO1_13000115 [Diplodia corticola]